MYTLGHVLFRKISPIVRVLPKPQATKKNFFETERDVWFNLPSLHTLPLELFHVILVNNYFSTATLSGGETYSSNMLTYFTVFNCFFCPFWLLSCLRFISLLLLLWWCFNWPLPVLIPVYILPFAWFRNLALWWWLVPHLYCLLPVSVDGTS